MKTVTHNICIEDTNEKSLESIFRMAEEKAKEKLDVMINQPSEAKVKLVGFEIDLLAWVNREFGTQRRYEFELEIKI